MAEKLFDGRVAANSTRKYALSPQSGSGHPRQLRRGDVVAKRLKKLSQNLLAPTARQRGNAT